MKLNEFCTRLGVKLKIMYPDISGNYYVNFDNCEFKNSRNSSIMRSMYGRGKTPDRAISNLIDRVKGKYLVINAYGDNRREYFMPELEV